MFVTIVLLPSVEAKHTLGMGTFAKHETLSHTVLKKDDATEECREAAGAQTWLQPLKWIFPDPRHHIPLALQGTAPRVWYVLIPVIRGWVKSIEN
jgi:hypothetical protein